MQLEERTPEQAFFLLPLAVETLDTERRSALAGIITIKTPKT